MAELYDILRLRSEIFIVEQNCPYQDLDNKDQQSQHLLGINNGELISYVRLIPKGVSYDNNCSIGRVVTNQKYRGNGLGKELMHKAIKACRSLYGDCPIKISAQHYLLKFYNDLGFEAIGDTYLEDNFHHISIILN